MSAQPLPVQLQNAVREYQKLQTLLANTVGLRQGLDAQLSENEMVKKEFEHLTPENTVFKLIGPVLVKQDAADAKSNVETRLTYIKDEIKRMEAQIKDLSEKSEQKKSKIVQLQTAVQHEGTKGSLPSKPAVISP